MRLFNSFLISCLCLLMINISPSFGQLGAALNFNSSNLDHATCGDVDLSTCTIEAWVKTSTTGNNTICSKGVGNGAANTTNYIFSIINGKVSFYLDYGGAPSWKESKNSILNNTFTHVAVSYDNSANIMKFYINGIIDTVIATTPGAIFQDNSTMYIGRQGTVCNCNYFNGEMDELRIWNTVRSCYEIAQSKDCEVLGTSSGLINYYKFNQGTGGGNNIGISQISNSAFLGINGVPVNFGFNGAISNFILPGGVVTGTNCSAIVAPSIEVKNATNTNIPLSTTDVSGTYSNNFGPTLLNQNATTYFTIKNSGTAILTIDSIRFSGPDASSFSVGAYSPSLAPTSSMAFPVIFNTSILGVKNASIIIYSNYCVTQKYDFALQGTGSNPGAALNFEGTVSKVNIPYDSRFNLSKSNFSVEYWAKPTDVNGKAQWVISKDNGGNDLDFLSGLDSNNKWTFRTRNNAIKLVSPLPVVAGTFYHIAFVLDSITAKLYIDGVEQANAAFLGTGSLNTSDIIIGARTASASAQFFKGDIDEVRLWNRAICLSEIIAYRYYEILNTTPGLVANYRFNNGVAFGTNFGLFTLVDAGLNNLDGTLSSFNYTGSEGNYVEPSTIVNNNVSAASPIAMIEVIGGGSLATINNHDTSPSSFDDTDFGSISNTSTITKTYTIKNIGLGGLTINSITISGSGASSFIVGPVTPASPIIGGGSATFTVTFDPTANGIFNADVVIFSTDCDKSYYKFAITGTGITAPAGAALNFNGGQHISVNNPSDFTFDVTSIFTIECWVRTSNVGRQVIFSNMSNVSLQNGYELFLNAGKLNFVIAHNYLAGINFSIESNGISIANGDWHHVGIVYKGATNDLDKIEMYIDGAYQAFSVTKNSTPTSLYNTNPVYIGVKNNGSFIDYFVGDIDDFSIYDKALCSSEIASFKSCEKTGSEPGLLLYYKFNNGFAGGNNTSIIGETDLASTSPNLGTLVNFSKNGPTENWIVPGGLISGTSCGALVEPITVLKGNNIIIANADAIVDPSDNTDFGNIQINVTSKTSTFFVFNTGARNLNFRKSPQISIAGDPSFSIASQPSSSFINPTKSDKFTVKFTPTTIGLKTAVVTIITDDCTNSVYTFTISGIGIEAPDINVNQGGTQISNGGIYDFGSITKYASSPNIGIAIENLNLGSTLLLAGPPPYVKKYSTGEYQDFTLSQTTITPTIPGGSNQKFSVVFTPSGGGIRNASLYILSDDADEPVYVINLTGYGLITGDINLTQGIDGSEIAGDIDNDNSINYPSEITGDVNGDALITLPIEFAGDINGNNILDPNELLGDVNGNGSIDGTEILGDADGNGVAEIIPNYILQGKGTIVMNQLSRFSIEPELPAYFDYAWFYSDSTLYMIKDTTRSFMDVVADYSTKNGKLTCIIYQFGSPFDTLDFTIKINKSYVNVAELAVLDSACAAVFNPSNKCEQNYIDYFKLQSIDYENNGCVIGGYQDLTATNNTTDLEMGFTYTVELKPKKLFFIPNPLNPAKPDTVTLFYAIWIDYNNDGDFEDAYEYVKSGESKSEKAELINITIVNNKLNEGSTRLRVGMRSGFGFTANEACSVVGESGELEDYLITLVPMRQLEGPNFLSPNGDGVNDIFSIKGIDADKSKIFTVFTKGGVIVYTDENYNNEWSGLDKDGKLLPKGTYYYIFKNDSAEIRSFMEIDY